MNLDNVSLVFYIFTTKQMVYTKYRPNINLVLHSHICIHYNFMIFLLITFGMLKLTITNLNTLLIHYELKKPNLNAKKVFRPLLTPFASIFINGESRSLMLLVTVKIISFIGYVLLKTLQT